MHWCSLRGMESTKIVPYGRPTFLPLLTLVGEVASFPVTSNVY
jgi:hypothetical protein